MIVLSIVLILNFGISWFNAWSCGRCWHESEDAGGWTHFVTWCATIMSAAGFTWVYLFLLAAAAGSVHYKGALVLSPHRVQQMLELGYIVIILPVLGSGLGMTVASWQSFARRRSLANGGVAAYNSFAQIYNTVEAVRVLPGFLHDIGDLFKGDDDDASARIVFLLVIVALLSGVLTTAAIIKRTARVHALEVSGGLRNDRLA